MQKISGFTLMEILIVLTLLLIIVGISIYFYFKLSKGSFSLEESAGLVVSVLNLAKQKSIVAEDNSSWGVLLKNNLNSPDYIYLFKDTPNNIIELYKIPGNISFFDFNDKIIIFKKLTGETTQTTIKIGFLDGTEFIYIKIPSFGAIIIDNQP